MINIAKFIFPAKLRKVAIQRRLDATAESRVAAEEARRKALEPLQRAIKRGDTRGIHDRLPAAREATLAALRAGR